MSPTSHQAAGALTVALPDPRHEESSYEFLEIPVGMLTYLQVDTNRIMKGSKAQYLQVFVSLCTSHEFWVAHWLSEGVSLMWLEEAEGASSCYL